MAEDKESTELTTATSPDPAALAAKATEVLAAPPDQRAGLLLASADTAALVPRIPPEELLFTLRGAKGGEISELLSHARPSQMRFVLDMELWDRDELRIERGTFWLKLFDNFEVPTLERFVKTLDFGDLVALTGKQIQAGLADENGHQPFEEIEDYASFTLDGTHYYQVREELLPVAKKFITLLMSDDRSKYLHLLEIYMTGLDPEDEETALRLRRARIAEHGFVDFEEAQAVYKPMKADALKEEEPRREGAASVFAQEGYLSPRYPVAQTPHGAVRLRELLDRFADSDQAEPLMAQLATLTNKVLAADALDPADTDSYRSAALKVAGYLSIGLEALCGDDLDAMERAIDRHWLEQLFRVGWDRVEKMGKKAKRWLRDGWPQGHRERLLLLNSPLPEVLGALLGPRPKLLVETESGDQLFDFSSIREVELAERTVEKADFLGQFVMAMVNFSLGDLTRAAQTLDEDNLKGRTIFLTALLNAALGRGFTFTPIPRGDVMEGLQKMWDPASDEHRVEPGLAHEAIERSQQVIKMTKEQVQFLREFINASINQLEEEFGGLPKGTEPDPRFLRGLWID